MCVWQRSKISHPPPCQEHSAARNKNLGSRDDADAGLAVLPYLRAWRPPFVFVENVEGYKRARSFKAIIHELAELGYWYDVQVLNAADFGVPQTRRRLIVRACRDGMVPQLPQPLPWIGWYEAIEDLIPTLPESKFAEWQLKRLPEQWRSMLVHPTDMRSLPCRDATEPAFTITAGSYGDSRPCSWTPRTFLVPGANDFRTQPAEKPSITITGNGDRIRAFLVGGANTSAEQAAPGVGDSDAGEPARCVNASNSQHWRAFLVNSENTSRDATVRSAGSPAFTILAGMMRRPISTPSAWLEQGRVVKMNPRALARFQSVPDWYQLPDQNSLATKITGNGVPSRFARWLVAVTYGLSLGDPT